MEKQNRQPLLFRYPGGKHYAIDILAPFWREVDHTEYREPFAGGATVFFNKPPSKINWLNDLDAELITTYKVVSSEKQRKKLIRLFENETATPKRWQEVLNFEPNNDLEIAFKYFYLNRTSFSGKLISPAWGYRPKRSLPPERWHERLIPCGEKVEQCKLTSLDFQTVIEAPAKKEVLMYIDPPYFKPPKKKHYRHGLTIDDHVRLSEVLQKTDHKFFLTYDDVPEVRRLYSWANVYPVNFFYRVDNSNVQSGSRRVGFELVITNYEMKVSTFNSKTKAPNIDEMKVPRVSAA